jgi:hypothetical protein
MLAAEGPALNSYLLHASPRKFGPVIPVVRPESTRPWPSRLKKTAANRPIARVSLRRTRGVISVKEGPSPASFYAGPLDGT